MAQLGRFVRTVASSTTGHPISGASVTVYREGATVNGVYSGPSPLNVTVRDLGKIKVGDTVFVGTDTSTLYNVNSITGRTILVLSGFSGTLNLGTGDRLVPSNNLPTLYGDDQGGSSTSNPLTTSSIGLAEAYVEFGAYDHISVVGSSKQLIQSLVAATEAPGQVRYADSFTVGSSTGGIQEAIDDLPTAGGHVWCSAKTYSISSKIWLHSGVHLHGAGIGATVIQRAAGSIIDFVSPHNSGDVIGCGPKGSNGTQFSSGTQGSNIGVHNCTLDGNYSNFSSLTDTNLSLGAIRFLWTNGVTIENVKAQNTLEGGFYISNCSGLLFNGLYCDTVGQWSTLSSRNGLTLTNNDNSTTNTNQGAISNFYFKTVGDEAITLLGCQNLSISNGAVNGADFGIEITGSSSVACSDLSFSNINMVNLLDVPITLAPTAATVTRCSFSDMSFIGHASLHDAGAIYMGTTAVSYSDLKFSNLTFTNINTKDTTARSWIDIQCGSAASRQRIQFNNISIAGLSGSINTGDVGINIRGPQQDLFFSNIFLKDVAGIGISIADAAADTISNIHFNKVMVDGANYFGCRLRNTAFANTIKEVYFNGCVMKDCAKRAAGSNAGWHLNAAFAGSSIDHIYLNNCRSYRTSGVNHLYGLNLLQTAGTLDNVEVTGCDFSGTQTDWFLSSGTVTNVKFRSPSGRGTDILSAATIVIPPDGDTFHVTAANNITNGITVNPWSNGRLVVLIFDSTPTVSDTGTSKLAGNFVATADDTLTIKCDGTNWYEVTRSAN